MYGQLYSNNHIWEKYKKQIIRDRSNRQHDDDDEEQYGHSEEFYKYFSDQNTDDEIFDSLSKPELLISYINDIIMDYEISIINETLHLL